MNTAGRSAVAAGRSRYMALLGFFDSEDLARQTTCKIITAIEERGGLNPPIAVSSVAEEFMISPVPFFDSSIREGTIEFEPKLNKFIIKLNKGRQRTSAPLSEQMPLVGDDPPDLQLDYRGRFTYAHEFAHRFFFIDTDRSWQRALHLAAQEASPELRSQVLSALHETEEKLCNRIAGDILVPKPELVRILGNSLVATQRGGLSTFFHLCRRASRLFRVSYECILVRLQRAIRDENVEHPQNLCVFLLRASDLKIGAGRSRWDIRVRESIVPRTFLGDKVDPPYPGIAVRHLGNEAHTFAESMLKSPGSQGVCNVELHLTLLLRRGRGQRGSNQIEVTFNGWSAVLSSKSASSSDERGILLWGVLV